ncbi:stress-responsive transcription factor hsf1 [Dinochytrium kinnereticum]|nr:stress-responsive transcription factor hsf1 [Dinochytrium kinnereticum]
MESQASSRRSGTAAVGTASKRKRPTAAAAAPSASAPASAASATSPASSSASSSNSTEEVTPPVLVSSTTNSKSNVNASYPSTKQSQSAALAKLDLAARQVIAANNAHPAFAAGRTSAISSSASIVGSIPLTASAAAATVPAKASIAAKNVPAFLNKLYNMVSDASTNDLIHWSKDGHAFIVHRHEDFARDVLPRFFKHNNFSSFVRQLNMYGFHKIPHIQQGALFTDGEPEMWEFANPNFQRGHPDLLCLVTRKKSRDTEEKEGAIDLSSVLHEISAIKRHQYSISNDLKSIQRENQILWTETIGLRDRYQRQQNTIDKIVRFLASVVSTERPMISKKRRLMLEDNSPIGNVEPALNGDGLKDISGMCTKLKVPSGANGSSPTATHMQEDLGLENFTDIVQQKVLDLIQPKLDTKPATSLPPTSIPDPLADLVLDSGDPTMDNLSSLQHVTRALNDTTKAASSIEDNINLLDMHLNTATNLLGIEDPLEGINVHDFFDVGGASSGLPPATSTASLSSLAASSLPNSSSSLNLPADIFDSITAGDDKMDDEDEDDPIMALVSNPIPRRASASTPAATRPSLQAPQRRDTDDILNSFNEVFPASDATDPWRQNALAKSAMHGATNEVPTLLQPIPAGTPTLDPDFDLLLGNALADVY